MASLIAPSRGKLLAKATQASSSTVLPGFLLPAWQQQSGAAHRQFSTTSLQCSKLGRTPLAIPPGVEILMSDLKMTHSATSWKASKHRTITVNGPLGSLSLDVPEFVNLKQDLENKTVELSIEDANAQKQKEMWGTSWAYLNNYITGVSEGHTAILRLVGVGYRATVEKRGAKEEYPGQPFLCLKLGFTHPVEVGIPKGVKVSTPAPTRILIEGSDRETIMSFAGKVRLWRKPEPYKGKGIFINDETIKLKSKKIS